MSGFFVTGTDTGVGKTLVSAALVSAARSGGCDAVPMKPVQTGCVSSENGLVAPDLELVCRLSGLTPDPADLAPMCPYRFEPACSPHLAADMAGETISTDNILNCFRTLSDRHELVVVEGAGGILVPLGGAHTVLDLIKGFALPVVIASRPGLGTINHSLMTVRLLESVGARVAAIVMVHSAPVSADKLDRQIEDDNRSAIESRVSVPVLGPVPYIRDYESQDFAPADFLPKVLPVVESLLNRKD